MGKILDLLFGKEPQIFDSNGNVSHRLPKEKWDAWQARYLKGDEFNWRNHTGMRAKESPAPKDKK
ncbi:MAG: hypothetical protein K1X29_08835 [Bdellovibrionales bacterium]|nr:hypothetical protein [Bdellovibrionales bacterium]